MKFTLKQVAEMFNGEIEGDDSLVVSKLVKIEEGEAESISFLANPAYAKYIYGTKATAVIVSKDFVPEKKISTVLIRVENPYEAFTEIMKAYERLQSENQEGVSKTSIIDGEVTLPKGLYVGDFVSIAKGVVLAEDVKIHPNTSISKNVKIGRGTVIHANVSIYHDTVIGENCTVHSGSVIGADGFGFVPKEDGTYDKIPQMGNVIIEDNVDIGANTCVDRATMGSTRIKKGTKIDNLVQVAHNVEIGRDTAIASQCGLAGTTKIGNNVMLGGQVGVSGHLTVGDGTKASGQAGINADVAAGQTLMGSPAINYNDYIKSYIYFKKLPDLVKRIEELEQQLKK